MRKRESRYVVGGTSRGSVEEKVVTRCQNNIRVSGQPIKPAFWPHAKSNLSPISFVISI